MAVDSVVHADSPASWRRRVGLLGVSMGAWLACFAGLARFGTWTPFAVAGLLLVPAAFALGAVRTSALRPTLATVGVGLAAGLVMIALTRLGFAVAGARIPEVRVATAQLFELLNVGGFSPGARAGLIVVIASCEEVLFRGPLPAGPARAAGEWSRRDIGAICALAVVYALATVTLGSALLAVTAFGCALVWGALRVGTGSLAAPIVAHVSWDLGVLVLWPLV